MKPYYDDIMQEALFFSNGREDVAKKLYAKAVDLASAHTEDELKALTKRESDIGSSYALYLVIVLGSLVIWVGTGFGVPMVLTAIFGVALPFFALRFLLKVQEFKEESIFLARLVKAYENGQNQSGK